jgi:hypothetical protein
MIHLVPVGSTYDPRSGIGNVLISRIYVKQ